MEDLKKQGTKYGLALAYYAPCDVKPFPEIDKFQFADTLIIGNTIIEEDWGKSHDDYLELQNEYDGIYFAYDGMEVSQ